MAPAPDHNPMKRIFLALSLITVVLPLPAFAAAPAAAIAPITIWFRQPAGNWNEALQDGDQAAHHLHLLLANSTLPNRTYRLDANLNVHQ